MSARSVIATLALLAATGAQAQGSTEPSAWCDRVLPLDTLRSVLGPEAARVERRDALLHQSIGQRNVAADHQITGLGMFDQIVIGCIRPARHHDQPHAGERRLDLALAGNQQHVEPPFEGELDHLVLGCTRAGIGIDPHAHGGCLAHATARLTVASSAAAPANIAAKLRLTRRC